MSLDDADLARRALLQALNGAGRRLRQAQREGEWATALLDAATEYGRHLALFAVEQQRLRMLEVRGGSPGELGTVPLGAAFKAVVATAESVVALRSDRELTAEVARLFPGEGGRAHLVPVLHHGRTVAVLYADSGGGPVEVAGLELLTALAAAALPLRSQAGLVSLGPP